MTEHIRGKLLPGFPQKRKFQTKEEVDAYFASDKIQCLLCGKWFKAIGWYHLKSKHGITTDDYKEIYGLPWLRGLSGARTHEKKVEMGKRGCAARGKEQMLKDLRSGKPSPPRRFQPFRIDMTSKLALKMYGMSRNYRREDFEAILERMRHQRRTLYDVCNDSDMPSKDSWRKYAKKHPEIKEKHREILYDLSYSLQAESRDLSPRFSIDCKKLRASGMGVKKIATVLGVPYDSVKRVLQESPGGFHPLDSNGRPKWRMKDYEAVLDRMRKQQRVLSDVCRDLDLPYMTWWRLFAKKHPELKEKVRKIQSNFSYPKQFKAKCISPRFGVDCQRLRARGMGMYTIAAALGVSPVPVRRSLQESPGGYRPLEKRGVKKWRLGDFEAVLDRMRRQKRLLTDVCGDPDMPGHECLNTYAKKHPEFREKMKQTYYSLPYSLQSKGRVLSPQLESDCQTLRARGMSLEKIGNKLDISYTTVRRVFEKDPAGFQPLENKGRLGYRKWRKEDYEAILDRMRKQKRLLTDVCSDPDLPGVELWRKFKTEHPGFEEKYRQVLFSFPYPMQIGLGVLSPGLIAKCLRMRSRGHTHKEIGDELGVSMQSAGKLFLKIEKEGPVIINRKIVNR